MSRSEPGRRLLVAPPWSGVRLRPRGSRSGSGSSVPVHQRLLAPSDHSRVHRDFAVSATYTRCLRCAGTPRRPTSGSELSLRVPSWHAALYVLGKIRNRILQSDDSDMAFAKSLSGSALPVILPSASSRARFRGLLVHHCCGLSGCSPPLTDLTGCYPATRAFTSRFSMSQSPFPLLDITTTDSGLLCRWDSHELERQLASLHQIRTSALTHTAPTLDEWRGSVRQDKDAVHEVLEARQ